MNETGTAAMTPELEALKTKLKATWETGDFEQIAKSYEKGAIEFIKSLNIQKGEKYLDVACGAGSTALPAARAGAIVTGIDLAEYLIEKAREKAQAEDLNCQFEQGDAEELPYADGSFDTVLTMFGAMFAPRPEKVAAELTRVCRSGGRIVMGNWTKDGFVGEMFKTIGAHVPPPPMPSPILWGDEATVRERFKDGIADLQMNRRMITFYFPFSPEEAVEQFRNFYGPTQKAFDSLSNDKEKQNALRRDLEKLWREKNEATDGTTVYQGEYLEVIATRE